MVIVEAELTNTPVFTVDVIKNHILFAENDCHGDIVLLRNSFKTISEEIEILKKIERLDPKVLQLDNLFRLLRDIIGR